MNKHVHCCKYMGNDQYPGENPPNYCYKWDGQEGGWRLHSNDAPLEGSPTWQQQCNWCSDRFPVIDLMPKLDPLKGHRCEEMIRGEWNTNQCYGIQGEYDDEDDFAPPPSAKPALACFAVIWDGFSWNMMNDEEVTGTRLRECPYCRQALRDPRTFKNKVVIT